MDGRSNYFTLCLDHIFVCRWRRKQCNLLKKHILNCLIYYVWRDKLLHTTYWVYTLMVNWCCPIEVGVHLDKNGIYQTVAKVLLNP